MERDEYRAATMCPVCGGDGEVFKTYIRPDGVRVRKRCCKECEMVFETMELYTRTLGRKKRGRRR